MTLRQIETQVKPELPKLNSNSILYKDINFPLGLNLLIAGSGTLSSPYFFIDNLHYKVFKSVNGSYHSRCYFFSFVNLFKMLSADAIHL